ncbi:MAG: Mur ligase domain-containing protein, partial [Saprospiraceae bacterium]
YLKNSHFCLMRIHIIAMGGAVMHNLSIALHISGHDVTGSDDEIYNPAKDRLKAYGLLPAYGWFPEKINSDIELVIVGMHAKKDNPELARARELNLKIMSYPAYIYEHAKNKNRIVIAGSHGKTSTTSMIMHVLRTLDQDYDYLVGAPLEGFDLMIRLSDAPLMVIEGDEYLSSPIDPSPKIMHYQPHSTIITGIAWDHINVFPTQASYIQVFRDYINGLSKGTRLYYFSGDKTLYDIVLTGGRNDLDIQSYSAYPHSIRDGIAYLLYDEKEYPLKIFGMHNLENVQAAVDVCISLGINELDIIHSLTTFTGAAKRLQPLFLSDHCKIYLDFAHAPSKVAATVKAIKDQYPSMRLITLLELHTFSSLNKNFIPQYAHALDAADEAIVFFNKHTLEIKGMPDLDPTYIKDMFKKNNLKVFTQNGELEDYLSHIDKKGTVVLFMSSGTFNGVQIKEWTSSN